MSLLFFFSSRRRHTRCSRDWSSDVCSSDLGLRDITVPEYPAFVLAIPDTVRARLFADSVDSWDRQSRFPSLVIMALPRDHTRGRQGGAPTPRSMVADNDLALGQIVRSEEHTRAWDSLALFVLEDDAQDGPDHVDAHRSVLLVASPYARHGIVDSTFYTTSSVVRSIGLILGLRSEEHTSELQSRLHLVCRLLLEKKKTEG